MSTSSVSRTRATNLTGLIDIDSLVEANLLRQKTKINTATQKLMVQQYKQEQYRDIMTQSKTFYNKYCDILSSDSLFKSSNYNTIKYTSSNSSVVTATGSSSSNVTNYEISVAQLATKASITYSKDNIKSGNIIEIKVGDGTEEKITLTLTGSNEKEIADNLNSALKEKGIKASAKYSDLANNGQGGLVIESNTEGYNDDFNVKMSKSDNGTEINSVISTKGTNLTATIKDGNNTYSISNGIGSDKTTISGNSIILDGTIFTFASETVKKDANGNVITGSDTPVTLSGKTDGTELKDKIVDFINDYNSLLGAINTKLYETYDKSYQPLTDEDKEGLTDSQIEKLEKKAQTGLLRNDEYLRAFADDMKQTMSTVLTSGTNKGLSLEKIGINPVNDYTTENGLFTIDEDKLLSAIESDPDGVKELFTKGMANSTSSSDDGVLTKLKKNLSDHATGTFSILANKAGVASGVTATTNEMTKDIEQRKKLITQMQTALQEKEDALYTKYSTLESNLSSLQSQQSSLSSYFS